MAFSECEIADTAPLSPMESDEKNPSVDEYKIKVRVKMNDRRKLWRRHTLSDMDIIHQV